MINVALNASNRVLCRLIECDNYQFPCSYFYSPRSNRFSAPGFVCRQRARTIGTGAIKCPDYHSFTPSRWETPSSPFWRGTKIWNPLDQERRALSGKSLQFCFEFILRFEFVFGFGIFAWFQNVTHVIHVW